MPNNNAQQKLNYQPFLLAATIIALLIKVVVSVSNAQPILDWLFVVVVIIFIAALLVYVWDRAPKGKTNVTISTGNANRSDITAIERETGQVGTEHVNIQTKDIKDVRIKGVKNQQGDGH